MISSFRVVSLLKLFNHRAWLPWLCGCKVKPEEYIEHSVGLHGRCATHCVRLFPLVTVSTLISLPVLFTHPLFPTCYHRRQLKPHASEEYFAFLGWIRRRKQIILILPQEDSEGVLCFDLSCLIAPSIKMFCRNTEGWSDGSGVIQVRGLAFTPVDNVPWSPTRRILDHSAVDLPLFKWNSCGTVVNKPWTII